LEQITGLAVEPGERRAEDLDPASGRRDEPGGDVEQRGLAAAGRADDGDELADPGVPCTIRLRPPRGRGTLPALRQLAKADGALASGIAGNARWVSLTLNPCTAIHPFPTISPCPPAAVRRAAS